MIDSNILLRRDNLPAKAEELQEFILVGKEAINAHSARLRAIKKLPAAQTAYAAALEDGQALAEIVLDAEAKLGGLLEAIPNKPTSSRRGTRSLPPGTDKRQSHRAQMLYRNPSVVAQEKAKARAKGVLITSSVVRAAIKRLRRIASVDPVLDNGCTIAELDELIEQGSSFGTIYADPPWPYQNQATRSATNTQYKTMTLEDIAALPVNELAAEQSHLHLWTTNAFLFCCPAIMEAWGFEYKSIFVWVKPQMGIGNYWRVSHELLLLGVRGSLVFADHNHMSWGEYKRGKHSVKPAPVRQLIEQVSPGPRLELFARTAQEGWTVWGDQISHTLFTAQQQDGA